MKANLFPFEYEIETLRNKDNSKSRFGIVYGDKGQIIHTKKDSYEVVTTTDVSTLGQTFIDKGFIVDTFTHRFGEVIGLNIPLSDKKLTAVGEKSYSAVITIPNNGNGKGYLSIIEKRLICLNGATKTDTFGTFNSVKIPHNITYKSAFLILEKSLSHFNHIIELIEQQDELLNSQILTDIEAKKLLNIWFFNEEIPVSQKTDLTLDEFRKELALNPENLKCFDRYEQLTTAFNNELSYNEVLGLKLTKYTVFATITNYLTRREEKSKSSAPKELQVQRQETKVNGLLKILA